MSPSSSVAPSDLITGKDLPPLMIVLALVHEIEAGVLNAPKNRQPLFCPFLNCWWTLERGRMLERYLLQTTCQIPQDPCSQSPTFSRDYGRIVLHALPLVGSSLPVFSPDSAYWIVFAVLDSGASVWMRIAFPPFRDSSASSPIARENNSLFDYKTASRHSSLFSFPKVFQTTQTYFFVSISLFFPNPF